MSHFASTLAALIRRLLSQKSGKAFLRSTQDTTAHEPASAAWWNQRYRERTTPWDTGIVPPELRELVKTGQLRPPGITLDLGCGTGTNVCFLAELGFTAIGVDIAWLALAQARRKALARDLSALFCLGDVTNLDFLALQADFVLDVGCLHSLAPDARQRYVSSLARHTKPGSLYLLYGFDAMPDVDRGPAGFTRGEIRTLFAPSFDLIWHRPSRQGDRPVAWYLLQRRSG